MAAPWWREALDNGSRRHAPNWMAEEGDVVAGTVVGRGTTNPGRWNHDGVPFVVVKVEYATENGNEISAGDWRKLLCSRAALADMLEHDDPQPGDKLVIEYEGVDKFMGGFRHKYRSAVERAEREPGLEEVTSWS
ncbi:MAG TPA: hypothetical protein VIM33_07515 [Gaiellaceae bacterium]|jgi:RES domain-containing protein